MMSENIVRLPVFCGINTLQTQTDKYDMSSTEYSLATAAGEVAVTAVGEVCKAIF